MAAIFHFFNTFISCLNGQSQSLHIKQRYALLLGLITQKELGHCDLFSQIDEHLLVSHV